MRGAVAFNQGSGHIFNPGSLFSLSWKSFNSYLVVMKTSRHEASRRPNRSNEPMVSREADIASGLTADLGRPIPMWMVGCVIRLLHCLAIVATGFFIFWLYVETDWTLTVERYVTAIIVGGVLGVVAIQWSGGYQESRLFENRLGLRRLLSAWAIAFAILLAVAFSLKISIHFSRVWAVSWFGVAAMALATTQLVVRASVRHLARVGSFASRTVIVGAGEHGQRLADHLARHGDARINIIGFIDDRGDRVPRTYEGHEVLGDSAHLMALIQRGVVDQVFIALPWSASERLLTVMTQLAVAPVHIRLAPDLIGFDLVDREFTHVARLPMLHVFDRPISGWLHFTKMLEDKVLASLMLLSLGPLMLLIAAAIRLDSRGPVLFRQKRYGFNNNLIEVLKFRTMYHDRSDADCVVQTTRNDPRVTRTGDFLRRSSLDELPQLINVLRGDMSLVGPRPHAVQTKAEGQLFEDVVDQYAARHKVKPGITGWAQVNGWRGETDTLEKIRKRVEHDLYYIDNWSVWFDFYILLRTLGTILQDDKAY